MRLSSWLTCALALATLSGFAQERTVILEGYIFEDNNSGYLNEVKVSVLDAETSLLYGAPVTNREGYFALEVPADKDFMLRARKKVFETVEAVATSKNLTPDQDKIFVKLAMARAPGYLLEVTLAEERQEDQDEVDAISGSLIEVYNNSQDKEVLVLKDYPSPYFSFPLEQGNHYTLLIRSPGYFTKRIESFVNVDGCILCMDGVSEIGPGVSDNLAYGNEVGTLLANIELKPLQVDSAIELNNIYYAYNSDEISEVAAFELDKVVEMLRVNPSIVVELGSHTDSRGKSAYNRSLSQRRAQSAVDYILGKDIPAHRMTARGYGEDQLANDCADGIQCAEDKHARNRRTELKITGFTNDPFAGRPLAEIIADENLDALLSEVLNQGEYRAPEGGTPPVLESGETAEPEPTETETIEKSLQPEMETALTSTSEVPTSEVPAELNKLNANEHAPEATASKGYKPSLAEASADAQKAAAKSAPVSVIVPETTITNVEPLKLPTGAKFTGYRVLVFQSPITLADDQGELFYKYGTLKEEQLADESFGYMSGAFSTEVEARSYLKNVTTLFPEARLLRYVNGFIIENTK